MKITLYLVPEDENGKLMKKFLQENKLPFKEIASDDINLLNKVAHLPLRRKVSLLEVVSSHGVEVVTGFVEFRLKQLIEYIKKYKLKLR